MKKTLTACPPRTAVAYARYSSAGQRDVSIEQQLADIRSFADREGYTIVHEYADHARSGFKDLSARQEFNAMIASAAARGFDTVLCWKVDRFGRNRADSATFKQQLALLGISVVYVMEPIPAGAAGVLTEGMLEAIAEWYSRNLSENVTRGMHDNARKCLFNGTRILGYRRGSDNHYEIVEEEAAIVRRIFARYAAGYSAAVIGRELNAAGLRTPRGVPYTEQTLLRIIGNERYSGVYIWGDIRVPDGMPAIISRKEWEEAQRMRTKTARHVEQRATDFYLTGKAFCGRCGKAMIGDSGTSRSGTTHYYYTCQGHKSRSGCDKKNVRKDDLENAVIDFIRNTCFTEPEINRIADAIMEEMEKRKKKSPLAGMEQELSDVEKKISNINKAIAAGVFGDSTLIMLQDLEETAKDLRTNVAMLRFEESKLVERDFVIFNLHKFAQLDPSDPESRRKLINTFLHSVYVYDDHLKIVINAIENAATIPIDPSIIDSLGSDNLSSGVLIVTHPNQILFWYISRM